MAATWEQVLTAIEQRVPAPTFNRWFRSLSATDQGDGEFLLKANDEFDAVFLEKNFAELIRLHLEQITGDPVALKITHAEPQLLAETRSAGHSEVTGSASSFRFERAGPAQASNPSRQEPPSFAVTVEPARLTLTERVLQAGLKLQYSLDEFVVGTSNEFAHAAAMAVQQKPGRVYNPLFLYGSVGLGKTHLLNAIGIELLRNDPQCRVRYMTSEAFMNEMIQHLRDRNMGGFRARFRDNLDVLLIDDIQFIAGKDSTQREFFHTFNALHQSGAQIVLTSDRYPHEIPDLEERLKSRFQWGLIADIQAPSIETRLAILHQKAASLELTVPDDAALFLAENIRSNVRELEGALLRLHAFAEFNNRPVTLGLTKTLLRQFIQENTRRITLESIIKAVCSYFSVKTSDLKGKGRQRAISQPRQIAMWLAKKHTGLSYPQLGAKFGGRDHTTILAGCRRITKLSQTDKTISGAINHLERQLER